MKDNSNKLEKFLSVGSYILFGLVILASIILTICYKLNILTLISCIAGIMYVCFLSTRSMINFIIGSISTITYIIIAYQTKLFGEVIFYLCFDIPMIFISFFMWKKNSNKDLTVNSKKLPIKTWCIVLFASVLITFCYAFILKLLGGANVYLDALSSVASVIATLLMAFRYREQWFMWIIVYIISVALWATTFNLLMLMMSICCLISSIVGYIVWSLGKNIEKRN